MKKALLAILLIISAACLADGPEGFPIIADIRSAGFNACLCRGNTPEMMQKALDMAQKHGMKVILFSRLLLDHPDKYVPMVREHEALWQYYLVDEPLMKDWDWIDASQKKFQQLDPDAQCYINLLPNTGKDVLRLIGLDSYPQYLQAFSRISQPQISYDFYPVQKETVRSDKWYPILDDIRAESLHTGRPFWAYVLCVPHFIYPMPTIGHLRLQCYVNLAYGAQGIEYFSYSTPEPYKQYDFHDGPLLRSGKKSSTYTLVKQMNAELKPVASLFWKSRILHIEHKQVTGGEVLVSYFTKGGKSYTCFVNKSAFEPVTLTLRPKKYDKRITKTLGEDTVRKSYTLPAGDILILRNK